MREAVVRTGSGDSGTAGAAGNAADAGPINPALGCPRSGPTRAELGSKLELMPAVARVNEVLVTTQGLHWLNADGVYRLGSDGSSALLVAESNFPHALAATDIVLAWSGGVGDVGGIWTLPLGVDAFEPVLVTEIDIDFSQRIVLDDRFVYLGVDGIQRVPLAGGEPMLLADLFLQATDMQLDGGFLYYAESLESAVSRVPVEGGEPTLVTPEAGLVHHFLLDETAIYVADTVGIRRTERNDPTSDKLLLRHASTPSRIGNSLTRVLSDGDRLVFADRLDNVGWVTKDGSTCGYIIAEFLEVGAAERLDIALDATHLYIIDVKASSLYRIRRTDVGLAH